MKTQTVVHNFPPLYDSESRVLLLGSIPSPKSRELRFFYGHPQNRFWRVLSAVLGEQPPQTIEEKRAMCLRHHIGYYRPMRYRRRVRYQHQKRRAERHRPPAAGKQNRAYFRHRRQICGAVPQAYRTADPCADHTAPLHQSGQRRVVVGAPD